MQVLTNTDNIPDFIKSLGVGCRPLNDPFFEDSHKNCKVFERKGVTVEDEEELCHKAIEKFPCNACSKVFQTLIDFELHYHDCHHYVCAQCKKWRPTARLLEIHVQEAHDNFFKVLSERKPMYQCFVSECDMKFENPEQRREHCRKVHKFPTNYRYDDLRVKETKVSEEKEVKEAKERGETNEVMEMEVSEPPKKTNVNVQFGMNHKQKSFQHTKRNAKVKESTDVPTADTQAKPSVSPVTMFIPRQVQKKMNANVPKDKPMNLMELGESLPKI